MIYIENYLLMQCNAFKPEACCTTPHLCVSEISDAVGQGYCQGGFSADFTTVIIMFLLVNHQRFLGLFLFHCSNAQVLSFRMAKWYWEGQAATFGKVCITYQSTM